MTHIYNLNKIWMISFFKINDEMVSTYPTLLILYYQAIIFQCLTNIHNTSKGPSLNNMNL